MEPSGSSARRSGVAQKKRASTVKKGHPSKGHPSWEGVCSTLPIQRFSASVRSANTKTAGLNSNGRHRLFTHRKSSRPRLNGSVGYCSRLRLRGCNRRTRPSLSRAAGPARSRSRLDLPRWTCRSGFRCRRFRCRLRFGFATETKLLCQGRSMR
jgi:hypothetical protein